MKNEQRTSELHKLRTLHLFAGAGGGILADILLGHHPVCAVEIEPYCQQVLSARQKDGHLPWFPIFDDVQTFDGKPWHGLVDVVAGGFPCQDISAAGKGAGIEGSRSSMWKHMARIIGEIRPRYAFVENSPMLVGRGLATVLSDLAEMGYDAKWGIVGAHHVSAPHKRDRIWIVANSHSHTDRLEVRRSMGEEARKQGENWQNEPSAWDTARANNDERIDSLLGLESISKKSKEYDLSNLTLPRCKEDVRFRNESEISMFGSDCDVPNTRSERGQLSPERELAAIEQLGSYSEAGGIGAIAREWWATEPNVGRVAHGVDNRVDRLKATGNGQVPAVAALAWQILSGNLHE